MNRLKHSWKPQLYIIHIQKYKSNPRSFIIKYQCETIQCDQSTRTNIHADCDCIEKTLNILIQACVGNTQHLKAHTAHDLR